MVQFRLTMNFCPQSNRLFTVPYFFVKSQRSIVEFERSPSWPYFFRSSTPTLLTTSAPTHGHFVLSPGFPHIQKSRWQPLENDDRSLRLHGKIGDCEHFNSLTVKWTVACVAGVQRGGRGKLRARIQLPPSLPFVLKTAIMGLNSYCTHSMHCLLQYCNVLWS